MLERSVTPDGKELVLYERDGVFAIRVDGMELMTSRVHGSEEDMATLVLAEVRARQPHILVGGLGMGFTLRAVLNGMSAAGRITVAELLPEIVQWNRDHLARLTGSSLDDRRVTLIEGDVGQIMASKPNTFDAILLDVDNGPAALTDPRNDKLYRASGLATIKNSLHSGGILGVWSASPDRAFERSLRRAGYRFKTHTVRARRGAKGPKHTIFIAKT